MQVRHGLAHAIVDGDERALRVHGSLHRCGEELRGCKRRTNHLERHIGKRFVMLARAEQDVTWKYRVTIEKTERVRVFIDNFSRNAARG